MQLVVPYGGRVTLNAAWTSSCPSKFRATMRQDVSLVTFVGFTIETVKCGVSLAELNRLKSASVVIFAAIAAPVSSAHAT